MFPFPQHKFLARALLGSLASAALLFPSNLFAQGQPTDEASPRGNRAEISVTLHDTGGQAVLSAATVKLYHSGALSGIAATSKGRVFFILDSLGDYTITAEAVGYKPAQKDISLNVAILDEEYLVLARDDSGSQPPPPGEPLLAPKAEAAFKKSLDALHDNKLDDAQKSLDEALKLAPSHPDLLYIQGVIYLRRNQWDKAQTVLEKATRLDPKHARALSALGMALVDQGKFDQAVAPLKSSLAVEPDSWETHWALAKAYYHSADYPDALTESQAAVSGSQGSLPEAELLLAQSLTAVGRFEDSAQTLRGFLKNHPGDPGAKTAKHWLDRLAADGKIHSQ